MCDERAEFPFLGEEAARWEERIAAFEEAWQAGDEPRIEAYLPGEGPHRLAVLHELIATDLEYRARRGQLVTLEAYLEQFPELLEAPAMLTSLRGVVAELMALVQTAPLALPAHSPSQPRLGRFELRELKGRGSCGIVFRAWDPQRGCEVALKTPLDGRMLDRQGRQRLLREARNAGRLQHPGLVRVLEAGEVEGVMYLASEFIEGVTLAEWARKTCPTPPQAAQLLSRVARAVHWAHQRGIVHRDIKPSNILVDAREQPHLTDFGLAKAAGDVTLTASGQIVGTLAYMSPEQAEGDVRWIDTRSDVYSLGAVLYELLAGHPPFQGTTQAVLRQVALDDPPPPQNGEGTVPAPLARICLKAMAKQPSRRYRTAGELADDLDRWLSGQPVGARPAGLGQSLRDWAQRRPAVAALAAALLAALTLGVAGITVQWRRAESALHVAQLERQRAEQERNRAEHARRLAERERMRAEQQRHKAEESLRQAQQHFATSREILREMDALCQQAREAPVRITGFRKQVRQVTLRYHELLLHSRPAGDSEKKVADLALLRTRAAREAIADLDWVEAEHLLTEAITSLNQLVARNPSATARHQLAFAWYQTAILHGQRGQLDQAQAALHHARQLWEQLLVHDPFRREWVNHLRMTYRHLGAILRKQAQEASDHELLVQARDWCLRGLQMRQSVGEDTRYFKHAFELEYWLGQIEEDLDHLSAARFHYQRSVALYEALPENERATIENAQLASAAYHNLGRVLVDQTRPEEALDFYRRALSLRECLQRQDPDSPLCPSDMGGTLLRLGLAHQMLGEHPEALECYQRASQIVRGLLERYPSRRSDRFRLAQVLRYSGNLWEHAGAWQTAWRDYEQAAAELQSLLGQHSSPEMLSFAEGLAVDRQRLRMRLEQTSLLRPAPELAGVMPRSPMEATD